MRMRMVALFGCLIAHTLVLAGCGDVAPPPASFEGGTAGWTLEGASRAQTSVLGGSYSVYGEDFAEMSRTADLTRVPSLTLDVAYAGPDPANGGREIFLQVQDLSAGGAARFLGFGEGGSPRSWDLSSFVGPHKVTIGWSGYYCLTSDPGCRDPSFHAYVDNIAFR